MKIDEDRVKLLIDVLVKNNTWQVPTLFLLQSYAFAHYTSLEWESNLKLLPPLIHHAWSERISKLNLPVDRYAQKSYVFMKKIISQMGDGGV